MLRYIRSQCQNSVISFIFQYNFTQAMSDIAQRYQQVQNQLQASAHIHGRHANNIQLLAVSKTQPAKRLLEVYHLGQRAFGENYLQEAREKQQALSDYAIEWHFIGLIQSNKTREIAENFAWVHTVDRLKIATRLNDQRPNHLPPLNVCIQLNIDNEESKAGTTLEQLTELASAINALPRLRLRGLMVIPEKRDDEDQQLAVFTQVADTLNALQAEILTMNSTANSNDICDTLSMGMSGDMDTAIAAGSTIIRIGSAIFGVRN